MFGRHNYEAYSLVDPSSHLSLITNIMEQHLRVFENVDLLEVAEVIRTANPLKVKADQVLRTLVEIGYDRLPSANFLSDVETLIIVTGCPAIHSFYEAYLPQFLSYNNPPSQEYPPDSNEQPLFGVVHWSIIMLLEIPCDHASVFDAVQNCEKSLWGHPVYSLVFGRSMDGDRIVLSEWPMVFALLCLAFSGTPYATYFSTKLKAILTQAKEFLILPTHSLLWLTICAQLAHDKETYDFAKTIIDEQGGVPVEFICHPTLWSDLPGTEDLVPDGSDLCVPGQMPEFEEWAIAVRSAIEETERNVLACIIAAFLWVGTIGSEEAMRDFANLCMNRIVRL